MITLLLILIKLYETSGTNMVVAPPDPGNVRTDVLYGPINSVGTGSLRPSGNNIRNLNIEEEIVKQAEENGIDPELAANVGFCESTFRADVKNKTSSATGVFQFTRATFMEGVKNRHLDWKWEDAKDPVKNIDMAMYYMKKGQYMRWRDCYLKSINK